MLDKNKFTDDIWNRYEDYSNGKIKDKFFKKHFYKKNGYKYTTLVACLIILIGSFGIGYAGKIIYDYSHKEKIIQEATKTDFEKNKGYDYIQDMEYQNKVYYTIVTSYEEYIKYSERWDNLVQMNQNDFDDYFVIITAIENYSMLGSYISNITTDDNTLYLEFNKNEDEEIDINYTVSSLRLIKSYFRNQIEIRIKDNITDSSLNTEIIENQDRLEQEAIENGNSVIMDEQGNIIAILSQ